MRTKGEYFKGLVIWAVDAVKIRRFYHCDRCGAKHRNKPAVCPGAELAHMTVDRCRCCNSCRNECSYGI